MVTGNSPASVAIEDGYQVMTLAASDTPARVNLIMSKAPSESLVIAALLSGEAEDLSLKCRCRCR